MADNVTIPATGTGDATPLVATDQDGSAPNAHYQLVKAVWGALNTFNIVDTASGKPLPVQMRGSDGTDWSLSSGVKFVTVATDITRPADTIAYAADDAYADSTSAPTTGGFTFTSAGSKSGGSGLITDCLVFSSNNAPATMLQGEVWIFDTSVTAVNDNVAFVISDSEVKTLVAILPFTLAKASANNCAVQLFNLNVGFTCSGSANLRYLIKVKNAYTPASAEVLTVRLHIVQYD